MTRAHSGEDAARRINEAIPGAAVDYNQTDVWVDAGKYSERPPAFSRMMNLLTFPS